MAQGVPEIKDPTAVPFALVLRDNLRFSPATAREDFSKDRRIQPHRFLHVSFKKLEKAFAAYHPILDNFSHSSPVITRGKGAKRRRIDENEFWLIKGSDQVLPHAVVHPCLPPNARINLSDQRGGYLRERNTSEVRRGNKPAEIPYDPATKRHEPSRSLASPLDQFIQDGTKPLQRFGLLVVRHDQRNGLEACPTQTALHPGAI